MFIPGRVGASLVCAAIFAAVAPAQEPAKPAPSKPAVSQPEKAPTFVVAKSGDKLEVMAKAEFEKKQKQLADDYAKARQQYEKEKKAAEAAKKKFDKAAPKQATLEKVGEDYASRELATAALDKLKSEKKGDAPKEPGKAPAKGKGGDKKGGV